MLPEGVPPNVLSKLIVVPEQQRFADDYTEPGKYYIIDSWNDAVFIKTRSRATAQSIIDSVWGKGFFTVREVLKASCR